MRRKLKRSGCRAAHGTSLSRSACAALAMTLVSAACAAGCTGTVSSLDDTNGTSSSGGSSGSRAAGGSNSNTGGSGTSTGGAAGGTAAPGDPNGAGPRPLARLSQREYNNTVRDLLGDNTSPADQFSPDKDSTFVFHRATDVAPHDAETFQSAASALATAATAKITSFVNCDPNSGDETCARSFVQTFGLKAYRRPPTTAETTRLIALYTAGRNTLKLSFTAAIGMMIEAILQSPAFLYHWERPSDAVAETAEGGVVHLSAYEVASRLSYFMWGSMPDDKLMQAAAANQLATGDDIEAQATRMLADPKARDNVAAFFTELFEFDALPDRTKDVTVYKDYNPALVTSMLSEAASFTQNVVFDADGKLATLLGANYSFINQSLGKIYGVSAPGTTMAKQALDTSQRKGLLTQTAFLTLNAATDGSHPVKRGRAVYEKLLCGELPPPPPNVPPAKSSTSGGTTRQRYAEHESNPCTGGCHVLMDPIGYTFEHYDGIGAYRTMDNGGLVDSTSTVNIDNADVPVKDAVDLASVLASSETVRTCIAKQWLRYALGRVDTDADGPSVQHAREAFGRNDFQIRDVITAVASSRSFQYRSPAAGEVIP